jgi:recombination protein RecA
MSRTSTAAAVAGLADAEGRIERAFGAEALVCLEGGASRAVEVIPTGALSLDLALGIGGFPRGRIVEVYGPESSGKKTLMYHAIAEA